MRAPERRDLGLERPLREGALVAAPPFGEHAFETASRTLNEGGEVFDLRLDPPWRGPARFAEIEERANDRRSVARRDRLFGSRP